MKCPCSLGAVILIIGKSSRSPLAIFAILFLLGFGKPGTSVFRALLWNYVALIIGEKRSNWLLTEPLPKPWTLGYLAGGNFNLPRLHGKHFPNVHAGLLFGAYPLIATFLESFYLDTTAAEVGEKTFSKVDVWFTFLHPVGTA